MLSAICSSPGSSLSPDYDFITAVDQIKQSGVKLIVGSEANELLCKMGQVKGITWRPEKSNEIWEVENWSDNEWAEQALAEMAFAKLMDIQYTPDTNNLSGRVADYRVRRATNRLVLVRSDGDEDIFVAVRVERAKKQARVLGWLRGSEGKLPHFYQKDCSVIPEEALHDMGKLPGKEGLRATPPIKEPSC